MIKVYSQSNIKRGCRICQDNHLFHPYGEMKNWIFYTFKDFKCDTEIAKHILIYYHNNIPVAGLIIIKGIIVSGYNYNCGIYVRPYYRKRGIGKALLKKAEQKGFNIFPWMGSDEAAAFYQKVIGWENILALNPKH